MTDHTNYDAAPAAELLARRWQDGIQIAALPESVRPVDLHQGYALQQAFFDTTGELRGGWKLGLSSPAAMRAAKLDRPLIGQLPVSRCVREGAPTPVHREGAITVEFEIAVVLSRDIAPGQAPADVRDAIGGVHTAFELVRSRFMDRRAVGWPSFAGDNVGFDWSVLGREIDAEDIDAVIESCEVRIDGDTRARALSGDQLVDVYDSLRHLMDHAAEYGLTLRQGEIVSCGAIAAPFDLILGQDPVVLSAHYSGGSLTLPFPPA